LAGALGDATRREGFKWLHVIYILWVGIFYPFGPRRGILRINDIPNRLLLTVISSIGSSDFVELLRGYSALVVPSRITA
jgi:hypothetical protein